MRIESIVLRELKMRLKAPFETSSEVTWDRRVLLVEVGVDGLRGWSEITAAEDPFYNSETTDTAWHMMKDFIVPSVLGKSIECAAEIANLLDPIRGHEMAKAGMENAVWDIEAQQKAIPLAKLLGGTQQDIPAGVSIGIQDSISTLLAKIETELRAGYQRIKLKIKPGKDVEIVAAVRRQYPDIKLMVDANSAYGLEQLELLKALDQHDLMMIEQPLAWDDIYQHSLLQARLRTPICLDECIHNPSHAEAAIKLKACRIINIKLGRVGGHTRAKQLHDLSVQHSIPVWCGGMHESGIGRAHNIAMSALPGFVLPGDVSASQRYWDQDIIEPEVEVSATGTIRVPTTSGLGYSVRRERVDALAVRRERWLANKSVVAGKQTEEPNCFVSTQEARSQEHRTVTSAEGEIVIRDVEEIAELEQVEVLEQEVWGVRERDVVPASLLIAAKEVGALILGAFDGVRLVGFAFGFLGQEGGDLTVHSHILAVRAEYRDQNLGFRLKLAQRERALRLGVRQITWTFDPLRSRNAQLNFAKLGVLCDTYKIDFYGVQPGSFLHQNGTDRLWVRWYIDSKRVRERVSADRDTERAVVPPAAPPILRMGKDGEPCSCTDVGPFQTGSPQILEIPIDCGTQQSKHGREWRRETRQAFTRALCAGLVVADFYRVRRDGIDVGTYVLHPRSGTLSEG
ncbi:MAG: o-succinylbenzoate synthase [Candidatus Sulfotelmatobacter sp.]